MLLGHGDTLPDFEALEELLEEVRERGQVLLHESNRYAQDLWAAAGYHGFLALIETFRKARVLPLGPRKTTRKL